MTERPLHARVAIALGVAVDPGLPPELEANWADALPRYDNDWSAVGPLAEKHRVTITDVGPGPWMAAQDFAVDYDGWRASEYACGETPLIALCYLILALHEAGKLPK